MLVCREAIKNGTQFNRSLGAFKIVIFAGAILYRDSGSWAIALGMKTFGTILTIIGALSTLFVGYLWLTDGHDGSIGERKVNLALFTGVPLLVTGIFLILRENE